MKFRDLQIGETFYFGVNGTLYRKVTSTSYTYDHDRNAVWTYWTPTKTPVTIQPEVRDEA